MWNHGWYPQLCFQDETLQIAISKGSAGASTLLCSQSQLQKRRHNEQHSSVPQLLHQPCV
jgi:hypothetical protein